MSSSMNCNIMGHKITGADLAAAGTTLAAGVGLPIVIGAVLPAAVPFLIALALKVMVIGVAIFAIYVGVKMHMEGKDSVEEFFKRFGKALANPCATFKNMGFDCKDAYNNWKLKESIDKGDTQGVIEHGGNLVTNKVEQGWFNFKNLFKKSN